MKIRIIGPVGSGKTTLAYHMGENHNVAVTSLDELNWIRLPDGDKHRSSEERQDLLNIILKKENWIIEGTQFRDGQSVFESADTIYLIDLPLMNNVFWILKRWLNSYFQKDKTQYQKIYPYLKWLWQWQKIERSAILNEIKVTNANVIIIDSVDKLKKLK